MPANRAELAQDAPEALTCTSGKAAQHVHELLPRCRVIAFVLVCHALNHACGRVGLDEAGRHGKDPNPLRADFIRERLAVIGEGRFGRDPGEDEGESNPGCQGFGNRGHDALSKVEALQVRNSPGVCRLRVNFDRRTE